MQLSDLEFVIENPSGSYKKFVDSLDEYPILGVTYPTHYGYIKGYKSEDGHDLDVFIGNGTMFGTLTVSREEAPGGFETKMLFGVNQAEFDAIKIEYGPVVKKMETLPTLKNFFEAISTFKS